MDDRHIFDKPIDPEILLAAKMADRVDTLIRRIGIRYSFSPAKRGKLYDRVEIKYKMVNGFPFFHNGELTGNFTILLLAYRCSIRGLYQYTFNKIISR